MKAISKWALSRQQEDVKRIYDLAMACYEDIGAVAVLNAGTDGIETRDDAAKLFKSNDSFLRRMMPRTGSLQVGWIHRSFQEIEIHLSKLDFSRIAKFQDANQSTTEIFENIVNS